MGTSPVLMEDSDWDASSSSSGSSSPEYPDPTFEAQDAPLLNLPAELRNRIWSLALIKKGRVNEPDDTIILPPLLRTCQQIANEATQIYFANNKFTVTLTTETLPEFLRSLKAIGRKNAQLIKSIKILFDVESELEDKTPKRLYHSEDFCGIRFNSRDLRKKWDHGRSLMIEYGLQPHAVQARAITVDGGADDWEMDDAQNIYGGKWQSQMWNAGFW